MKTYVAILTGTLATAAVLSAGSQVEAQSRPKGVAVTTPAPSSATPELRFEPTVPPEQQLRREPDSYPDEDAKSRYAPAFLSPFVTTVRTGPTSGVRVGLSGWSAVRVPYDIPQATGGPAFGITFEWGVPVEERKAPEPEAPRDR